MSFGALFEELAGHDKVLALAVTSFKASFQSYRASKLEPKEPKSLPVVQPEGCLRFRINTKLKIFHKKIDGMLKFPQGGEMMKNTAADDNGLGLRRFLLFCLKQKRPRALECFDHDSWHVRKKE